MATYHFKEGYALPYVGPGMCVLKRNLDVPALIALGAEPNGLYVSDVATALASTGFAAADILNLFRVPLGFFVLNGGVRITTAGAASTTIDVGCVAGSTQLASAGNDAGFWLETALTSAEANLIFDATAGTTIPPISATGPLANYFITNGSIDVTFNTAANATMIADFWVIGFKAW